jgi:hypothetical protein
MPGLTTQPSTIVIDAQHSVDALLRSGANATSCLVLAHGAGAGMAHPFMANFADGLAERAIASLRFQFPYMQRGSKRPDPPQVAHAAVRAAVAHAAQLLPGVPLLAGGKSFGGRMTSQAQALLPLPGVLGLVFVGFALHPAGKPAGDRAQHLSDVGCPMLFLQGTRDELADPQLLLPVVGQLGVRATLERFEGADHGFHVPARSAGNDAQVMAAMLDATARWVGAVVTTPR